jgi:hypothetical protein
MTRPVRPGFFISRLVALVFLLPRPGVAQTSEESAAPPEDAPMLNSETLSSKLPSQKKPAATPSGDLISAVVGEHDPTAWAAYAVQTSDFEPVWDGDEPAAVTARLLGHSVEWTRPNDVLVLPRAQLRIEVAGAQHGVVAYGGLLHLLRSQEAGQPLAVELPVALLVDPSGPVSVRYTRDGQRHEGRLSLRRKPNTVPPGVRVHRDPSCSPYVSEVLAEGGAGDDWLSMGCRRVMVQGEGAMTQVVDLYLFWDNVSAVEVEGSTVELNRSRPLVVRLQPGAHTLNVRAAPNRSLTVKYDYPRRAHNGLLELSAGPNLHHWLGVLDDPLGGIAKDPLYVLAPLIVARLSYRISDTVRLMSLNAVNISARADGDFGLYANYEAIRALDRRFTINLLVGAHAVAFTSSDGYVVRFGAPQGAELISHDALFKNFNLVLGGFLYPPIAGKHYYNLYLRYGTPHLFVELNFLSWQEPMDTGVPASTRSLAVTIGLPLLRFL